MEGHRDGHGFVRQPDGQPPIYLSPQEMRAVLHRDAWSRPALFDWLQREGRIDDAEMHRVFNCGIGMAVVVAAADADRVMARLAELGETVWRIGEIEPCRAGDAQTVVA